MEDHIQPFTKPEPTNPASVQVLSLQGLPQTLDWIRREVEALKKQCTPEAATSFVLQVYRYPEIDIEKKTPPQLLLVCLLL